MSKELKIKFYENSKDRVPLNNGDIYHPPITIMEPDAECLVQ